MNNPIFFAGWHQAVNGPSGCGKFERTMISVNRLISRKSWFPVNDWILDSGAFTRIASGKGHLSTRKYAKQIKRWSGNGNLLAAVSQDYMCEPFILSKTGLTVQQHQRATIARYDSLKRLLSDCSVYLMPVLQGYKPSEYVEHLRMYGDRLAHGAWVGVGSVCKRNSDPSAIEAVLIAIHTERPDLRLHGFGLKKTALQSSSIVRALLYSADSQASSFRQRKEGGNANDPAAALKYAATIYQSISPQLSIWSVSNG